MPTSKKVTLDKIFPKDVMEKAQWFYAYDRRGLVIFHTQTYYHFIRDLLGSINANVFEGDIVAVEFTTKEIKILARRRIRLSLQVEILEGK